MKPQPPISTNGSLPEVGQMPGGSSRAPESGMRKGSGANDRQQEYIITEDDLDWFAHICDAYYLADSGGNRAAAIRSRKVTHIGNGAALVDPVCRCNSCKVPLDQCKGKTQPSDITKAKTRELVDELSKRTGVRLHTVGHKMYCRVFVGECDTGTILTWQTEHSEAYVLVVKP